MFHFQYFRASVGSNKRKDSIDKKANSAELPISPKREEPIRSPTSKPSGRSGKRYAFRILIVAW